MKKTLLIAVTIAGALWGIGSLTTQASEEVDVSDVTIEEMLTLALLDEYKASMTYTVLMETFGEIRPFVNIQKAEETHIQLLLPLFDVYGIELPEIPAVDDLVVPATIEEALEIGVKAEIDNIALYEAYLTLDLPDDVRTVFEQLVNASNHHLNAFLGNGGQGGGSQKQVDRTPQFKQSATCPFI
jgi:hypothetical protein